MVVRRASFMALLAALIGTVGATGARAEVRLPAVIGDGMVLQRDMWTPIWGFGDPWERVTVTLRVGDAEPVVVKSRADASGKWLLRLPPQPAGGPYSISVAGPTNSITVNDVLVGEVWVCSGQSNMQWPVYASNNPEEEIAAANYPEMRLFQVAMVTAEQPLEDTQGAWAACSPETVPNFTAVGYFFGRELHERLGVPVGLIQSAWGGTPAESWTSEGRLRRSDLYQPIKDH